MKVFRAETLQEAAYGEIVSMLRAGGVIAFPTDTAYGLGADPFNQAAIDRIFQIKGRAENKPILLIVNSIVMAESITRPSALFFDVAEEFWPGPLTLILTAAASVPARVTADTNTIGIRWPVSPFAATLLDVLKTPITATSANRSGLPSAITPDEVRAQIGESIDALIDGGELPSRAASTLLDLTVDPPVLLRKGPVSFETLEKFFSGRIRKHLE